MRSITSRVITCCLGLLATLSLCVMLSGPAKATPPMQALYGTIGSTPVAIYAENSSLGVCVRLEAQRGIEWASVFSIECGIEQPKLDSHGGAVGYIVYILPDINLRLDSYFQGGTSIEAKLDEAFNTSFKFLGTHLVPK